MLVVGHLKELKLSSDIRCDRASILGNPFELTEEKFRDEVIEAWRLYLKLVILYKNRGNGDIVVEPFQISNRLPISKTWKKPSANQIIAALEELVPLHKSKKTYRLMCWCRKSTSLDSSPKCHCDVIIKCIAKWSNNKC